MSKEVRRKLPEMLRELNLAGVAAAHEEAAVRAEKEGWGFERFLHHLVELELEQRRQRRLERVLIHHCVILELNGTSFRAEAAKARMTKATESATA